VESIQACSDIDAIEIDVCEERRESPRFPLDIFVLLPGVKTMRKKSGNISLGGVFLEALDPVAKGELIKVLFKLPDSGRWILVGAEVVGWQGRGIRGLRCRFTDLDFPGRRMLARWLDTMYVLRQVA
jgi:hypothetical protein